MADTPEPAEGPTLERTITLVDAVVAIAMTLLILPLVDVAQDLDLHGLGAFWAENRTLLMTFVISFVVIYAFWTAHGVIFRRLDEGGRPEVRWLSPLNLGWVLMIAFLPFPTALIGDSVNSTAAPIYLGTLCVISALTLAMTVAVHRAVGLPLGLVWLTTAVFGVGTVVSLVNASAGMYVLFALFVARPIEGSSFQRAVARAPRDTRATRSERPR